MHNFKLTLAYDGTDFAGWQAQPGNPTIQGTLTDVLRKLTQEHIVIHGAGRTDAGVHAAGQVASFKTQSPLSAQEFQRACNALMPPAIRVVAAEEMGPEFHARWLAQAKTYRYRIFRGAIVPPFEWRYVLHHPWPLDESVMSNAAQLLEGEHNFTSFAAAPDREDEGRERNALRTIYSSKVERAGEELRYVVRGRSFMRYMVRKIVGTLLDVGRGKMNADYVRELFELKDRSKSGMTVPPNGLCMMS
ncbi:MAG: tRNA pseudouridine(38-40) synthase TruA, partial [Acidobacteria bacterium]|nr:tRNA pseudouridine(38-40) synthase TruA [Acidobacteriota bacterium]